MFFLITFKNLNDNLWMSWLKNEIGAQKHFGWKQFGCFLTFLCNKEQRLFEMEIFCCIVNVYCLFVINKMHSCWIKVFLSFCFFLLKENSLEIKSMTFHFTWHFDSLNFPCQFSVKLNIENHPPNTFGWRIQILYFCLESPSCVVTFAGHYWTVECSFLGWNESVWMNTVAFQLSVVVANNFQLYICLCVKVSKKICLYMQQILVWLYFCTYFQTNDTKP